MLAADSCLLPLQHWVGRRCEPVQKGPPQTDGRVQEEFWKLDCKLVYLCVEQKLKHDEKGETCGCAHNSGSGGISPDHLFVTKKIQKKFREGEIRLGFSRWRIQELKEFLEKVLILCYSASHFRKGSKLNQTLKLSCFQATSSDDFEKFPT